MPQEQKNNQNRHSEGGTTEETLSDYLKIPRTRSGLSKWRQ